MKILLLGGPRFLGYALIEAAQGRGHELTLFNRGRSFPELFPEVERLVGDRDGDLSALGNRRWDVVIDTCGYVPRIVRNSARKLADFADHYTFVSSISVYADPIGAPWDETLPVAVIEDPAVEEITGQTYGALKALCEQAAEEEMPGRVLNVRPGLIVGPRDPSDRFTYWPVRAARGGRILAPGAPGDPAQIIDVRDLAGWMIKMSEQRVTGVFNATSPELTLESLLDACVRASGSGGTLEWLPDDFLLDHEVGPWIEIPLWLTGQDKLSSKVSVARAVGHGLAFRPLAETARDTLAWAETLPGDRTWRAGLASDREQSLLKAWDAHVAA